MPHYILQMNKYLLLFFLIIITRLIAPSELSAQHVLPNGPKPFPVKGKPPLANPFSPICKTPGKYSSHWVNMGPDSFPTQSMGIVVSIWPDPNDPDRVLAGTNSGGLFRCTNATQEFPQWRCITDSSRLPCLGVQDVIADPSGEYIYMATRVLVMGRKPGSGYGGGYGIGVVKCKDGLSENPHWETTSLNFPPSSETAVVRLKMHPVNSNIIYACAGSHIYKTTDGFTSKSFLEDMNLPTTDKNQTFRYVAFAQDDPLTVFVAGDELWKYNPLTSWQKLKLANPQSGSVDIASNKFGLYVFYHNSDGRFFIDLSTDNGNTFKTITYPRTPAILNYEYRVNSENPDIMYWGEGQGILKKSVNAGKDWGYITNYAPTSPYHGTSTHGDIRVIKLMRSSKDGKNDIIYAGTDGGILYSEKTDSVSGETIWKNITGHGLNIAHFYDINVHPTNPNIMAGGNADNGFMTYNSGSWHDDVLCDGYTCVFNQLHPDTIYGTANCGSNALFRSVDAGKTWKGINMPNSPSRAVRPIQSDRNGYIYVGCHDIYRTLDTVTSKKNHLNWERISDFTGENDVPICHTLTAIGLSSSDSTVFYAGFGDPTNNIDQSTLSKDCSWTAAENRCPGEQLCPLSNKLFVKKKGHWSDISSGLEGVRKTVITSIVVDPLHPERVWVTFGGFSASSKNKVMFSSDMGRNWKDFSEGLPDFAADCMVYENGSNDGLYLGTDVGVFYRNSSLTNWECFSENLPVVIVNALTIIDSTKEIVGATHGRGIWKSHLVEGTFHQK